MSTDREKDTDPGSLIGKAGDTIDAYSSTFVKLLFALWRVYKAPADEQGRLISFTLRMRELLGEIDSLLEDDTNVDKIIDRLSELSYLLLSTPLGADKLQCPLYQSLAILSVNPKGMLHTVKDFSSTLSMIIWDCRLLWAHYYLWTNEDLAWTELLQLLQDRRRQQLLSDCDFPLPEVINLRGYAMVLTKNDQGKPQLVWNSDLSEITRRGSTKVPIASVRQMIQDQLSVLRDGLVQLFLGLVQDLPAHGLDLATDSIYSVVDGQNFVEQNPSLYQKDLLLSLLCRDASLSSVWFNAHTAEVKTAKARPYLDQVMKWAAQLAVCMHLSSGPMCRVPELLSIKRLNSMHGARNLYSWSQSVSLSCAVDHQPR